MTKGKKKKGPGTAGPYGPKTTEPAVIPVRDASGNFKWAGNLKSGSVNAS